MNRTPLAIAVSDYLQTRIQTTQKGISEIQLPLHEIYAPLLAQMLSDAKLIPSKKNLLETALGL